MFRLELQTYALFHIIKALWQLAGIWRQAGKTAQSSWRTPGAAQGLFLERGCEPGLCSQGVRRRRYSRTQGGLHLPSGIGKVPAVPDRVWPFQACRGALLLCVHLFPYRAFPPRNWSTKDETDLVCLWPLLALTFGTKRYTGHEPWVRRNLRVQLPLSLQCRTRTG